MYYVVILNTKRVEIKILNNELEKKIVEHAELSKVDQKDKDEGVEKGKKMQLITENSKA